MGRVNGYKHSPETIEKIRSGKNRKSLEWIYSQKPIEQYCSVFGCGNKLSLLEKLCGSRCINHTSSRKVEFYHGKL